MIFRGVDKPNWTWPLLFAAAMLTACSASLTPTISPVQSTAVAPSAKSVALSKYYADLQYNMRLRGLIREDDGRNVASVNGRVLAENFETIALHDEYVPGQQGFVPRQTPSALRRWEKPIRMAIEFGASVPSDMRSADTQFIVNYAQNLSQVSGHPITMTASRPNYLVLVLGEDDRDDFAQRFRSFVPGLSDQTVQDYLNLPRSILCLVYAFPGRNGGHSYDRAVAVIRAEHPSLMRRSCIHEELAQGMGLANDSPRARPSIFNDDEEFGFLTRHDEMLLKLLYDPRLSVGMDANAARPTVQRIATELAG